MSEPLLAFQHITICAENQLLANDISFTLQEGEILVKAAVANRHYCALLPACRHPIPRSPGESLPGTATGSITGHPGKRSILQE